MTSGHCVCGHRRVRHKDDGVCLSCDCMEYEERPRTRMERADKIGLIQGYIGAGIGAVWLFFRWYGANKGMIVIMAAAFAGVIYVSWRSRP